MVLTGVILTRYKRTILKKKSQMLILQLTKKTSGGNNEKEKVWLEREIDKHNHKLELIRTILPVIIIILQVIILKVKKII